MIARRSAAPAALVIASLLVAACGGGDTSPSPSGAASPAPGGTSPSPGSASPSAAAVEGDLFVFGVAYETGDDIAKGRIDEFTEQYPDVNVTFSESGFDDQQFLTALNSGDPPDVARIDRTRIGTYIARGVLAPIDECVAQTGVDTGVFYDASLTPITWEGQVYGFPEDFNTRAWILVDSVFEDAGLNVDDFDPSDWDSIRQANQALLTASGNQVSRIGIDPKLPEFTPLWAKAVGVDLLSADGLTSNLDDPAVAEAVAFGASLIEDHGGSAPFRSFRDTWDFFGTANQVAEGQVGGWPMEQWYYNVLTQSPDVQFTVKPFMTRDGEEITYADGTALAIVEGTDDFAAACAYAATVTGRDAWVRAATDRAEARAAEGRPNTGTFTANRDANDAIFGEIIDLSESPVFQAAVETTLSLHDKAFALPASPAGTEFVDAMTEGVNQVLSGTAAADALAQADQDAQDAIDDAAR